jgi:lysozyme
MVCSCFKSLDMKTPQMDESEIRDILTSNGVDQAKVSIVAIRGYYLDSMGKRGANDRSIYDDAMFVVHPNGIERFQANTDPTGYRKGRGKGSAKGMAMLKTGIQIFGKGRHKGVQAFRQCEPFTVIRDGSPDYEDSGWHAIDLHSGGYSSTSSLGCQTIPKATWSRFKNTLYSLLDEYKNPIRKNDRGEKVRSFNYVLLDEVERRKGSLIVSNRYL